MNENANDENTITGKAMGNIMGMAASAAVLVGSAYAGSALVGKGVKNANKIANKAKNVVTRKGATEEMSELGVKAREIMKKENISGSKATRIAKKEMKSEAQAKIKRDLDEYDFAKKAKEYKNSDSYKNSVKRNEQNIATKQKQQADVLNKDLFGEELNNKSNMQDQINEYEKYMKNDTAERKTKDVVDGVIQ